MAAVLDPDVILMSYDVISLFCGSQRKLLRMYYQPFKFCCHSFNILKVKRWEANQPPSLRVPGDQKKPGLNRVNIYSQGVSLKAAVSTPDCFR